MTAPRMARTVTQLWQQGIRSAQKLNERSHGWLGILIGAVRDTLKPDSAIMAAAIAYFSLLSLFPIVLLSISIASFNIVPLIDQQLVIQELEFVAPALGQLLGQNIGEIIRARGPITGVALIGLLWSASTIFFVLTQVLNQIWGIKRRRPVWKGRGLSILIVLASVGPVLILASFGSSMIANLNTYLPEQVIPIGDGISFLLAILIDIALFMLIYTILPHRVATWREILPGAIGAGMLWELAKKAFLSFVSAYLSFSNLIYGSVATIIAFLVWAYLSSLILLFGAHLSVAYYQSKRQQAGVPGS